MEESKKISESHSFILLFYSLILKIPGTHFGEVFVREVVAKGKQFYVQKFPLLLPQFSGVSQFIVFSRQKCHVQKIVLSL